MYHFTQINNLRARHRPIILMSTKPKTILQLKMEISDISKVMREELSINGENKKAHLKQG